MFCVLVGCTSKSTQDTKPISHEEYVLREAMRICKKDATDMNKSPHNSHNPFWKNYFEMCMKTRYQYKKEDYKHFWY